MPPIASSTCWAETTGPVVVLMRSARQLVAGLVNGGAHRGAVYGLLTGHADPAAVQVHVHAGHALDAADLLGHRVDAVLAGHPGHRVLGGARHQYSSRQVGSRQVGAAQDLTRRAIASEASLTLVPASAPPWAAASTTQVDMCSSSRASAKDCSALVAAETWVSTSMQYLSSSTMRCRP